MSVGRFDLYTAVHKGLRAGLSGVLVRFGRADWHDRAGASRALDAAREVLSLCRAHVQIEDRHVHPALEAARPGITHHAATDHRLHEQEIAGIEAAVVSLAESAVAERAAAGAALYRRWVKFAAEDFEHMAYEEETHSPVLWEAYGDDELRAIQRRAVSGLPESLEHGFRRWIVAAINSDERARLPAPRASMAGPVLAPATPAELASG